MRKKPNRLVISVIILMGIGLYIGGYEIYWKGKKAKFEKEAKRIVPFATEDVQMISIKKKDAPAIVIERGGDGWKIVKPGEYEAEDSEIDYIASRLSEVSYNEEIRGGKEEDYGLAPPRISVEVKSKSGNMVQFDIGNDTPVGFGLYLKKGNKVFVADQGIYQTLDKSLSDLRRKKLFSFMTPDVTSFELIDHKTQTKLAIAREGNRWKMKEPIEYPADRTAVENTLRSIEFAEFTDFVSEGTPPEKLGLNPPIYTVVVRFKEPPESDQKKRKDDEGEGEKIQEAYFGKEESGRWYAVRKGSREIGYLAAEKKKDIFKDAENYKRKTLADFSEFDVTYVKAVIGKEVYEFERQGGLGAEKWFVKGTRQEVAFTDVGYLFDFLTGTKFEKAFHLKGNEKEYGLDRPKATIVVKDEEKKVLAEVAIGEKDGKYYANLKGEDLVFEIRSDQFNSLESKVRLMKKPGTKGDKKEKESG